MKFESRYLLCFFPLILKLYSIAAFLYIVLVLISLVQGKKELKTNFILIKKAINPIYLTNYYYKTQYYITDINKDRARMSILKKLISIKDKVSSIYLKYSIFFLSFLYLVQEYMYAYNGKILLFVLLGLIILIIVWSSSQLAYIAFKYTTLFYLFVIPSISVVLFFTIYNYVERLDSIFQIIIFLIIATVLYFMFSIYTPIYILRKLNGKTVIISALVTLTTQLLTLIVPIIMHSRFFTAISISSNEINNDPTISSSIKTFLTKPQILHSINYIFNLQLKNSFESAISLISMSGSLMFLLGGLVIIMRITRFEKKAHKLWLELCTQEKNVSYKNIKRCAYLGGTSYEDLIVNNKKFCDLIKSNEVIDMQSSSVFSWRLLFRRRRRNRNSVCNN